MKKGFTLAEMVLTIGIISFVAVVTIPQLKKVMPDKEKMLFKKAYYTTERIVSELVNDEDLYPQSDNPDAQYLANIESVEYKGKTYEEDDKFCRLFAAKLNHATDVVACGGGFKNEHRNPTFTTVDDGIVWVVPEVEGKHSFPIHIRIDVNGDKGPNCDVFPASALNKNCTEPDRFTIQVDYDGIVEPKGDIAREYLTNDKVAKDDR